MHYFIKLFERFKNVVKNDPIASAALVLSIVAFFADLDVLKQWLSKKPVVVAYHQAANLGRCPLSGIEVFNNTSRTVENLRITIEPDYLVKRGSEALEMHAVGPGSLFPGFGSLPFDVKPALGVEFSFVESTIIVPKLLPREYLQLTVGRDLNPDLFQLRKDLGKDPEQRGLPQVVFAAYEDGALTFERISACDEA